MNAAAIKLINEIQTQKSHAAVICTKDFNSIKPKVIIILVFANDNFARESRKSYKIKPFHKICTYVHIHIHM